MALACAWGRGWCPRLRFHLRWLRAGQRYTRARRQGAGGEGGSQPVLQLHLLARLYRPAEAANLRQRDAGRASIRVC